MAKRRKKSIRKSAIVIQLSNEITQMKRLMAAKDDHINRLITIAEQYKSLWAEEKTKFRYYIGEPIEEARKAILGIKK